MFMNFFSRDIIPCNFAASWTFKLCLKVLLFCFIGLEWYCLVGPDFSQTGAQVILLVLSRLFSVLLIFHLYCRKFYLSDKCPITLLRKDFA